jgi:hypothetical protein
MVEAFIRDEAFVWHGRNRTRPDAPAVTDAR